MWSLPACEVEEIDRSYSLSFVGYLVKSKVGNSGLTKVIRNIPNSNFLMGFNKTVGNKVNRNARIMRLSCRNLVLV